MIVVDASVLADFLLGRREATEAIAERFGRTPISRSTRPRSSSPETLNALRRLVLSGRLGEERRLGGRRAIWAAHGWSGTRTPPSGSGCGTSATT